MSGVWVFKNNGVMHLVKNPAAAAVEHQGQGGASKSKRKVLIHQATGQVMASYDVLEQILRGLGWERYHAGDPALLQFHQQCSIDLISLPRDFAKFTSIHMYDIVVKNPNIFLVRDM